MGICFLLIRQMTKKVQGRVLVNSRGCNVKGRAEENLENH